MTVAPTALLDVRALLTAHLPGLTPAAVGIVGDAAHRGGYHCGSDRVDADDYSVRESPRDRAGLTDQACALDIGQFSLDVGEKRHTLRTFSSWLVAQCRADTPDTRDIREVIYSTDGRTVRRWDRLGKRSTGDGSHRWHTHISFHRDAIKAGRDQRPLFNRYLTTIGVLTPPPKRDDLLTRAQDAALSVAWRHADAMIDGQDTTSGTRTPHWGVRELRKQTALLTQISATLAAQSGRDPVNEQAIVDGVLAGLGGKPLDQVAAALTAALGPDRAARLAELLASPAQPPMEQDNQLEEPA